MRIGCALGIVLAIAILNVAHGRGLEVEDALRLQEYTQVITDPDGRFTLVGRTRPYAEGTSYRYDWFNRRMLSELWIRDNKRGGRLQRLLGGRRDAGYWASTFAPRGRELVVFRLTGDRLSIGVADLGQRSVRWLPVRPDLPYINPNPTWLDDNRLLIVDRPDGSLPHQLAFGFAPPRNDPRRWQTTASGNKASVSVLGSGRMLGRWPGPAPRRLIVYDLRTGSTQVVYRGEIVDVAVAAGHRRAAVLAAAAELPIRADRPVDPADQTRAHRLEIVDLETGTGTPACIRCDVLPNLLAWSQSGGRLLFFARDPETPWESGRLNTLDGRSAAPAITPLIDRSIPGAISVHAGWMGETPVVWGTDRNGRAGRPDWFTESGALTGGKAATPTALVALGPQGYVFISDGKLWHGRADMPARQLDLPGQVSTTAMTTDPLLAGTRMMLNPAREGAVVIVTGGDVRQPVTVSASGRLDRKLAPLKDGQQLLAASPARGATVVLDRPARRGSRLLWATFGRDAVMIDRINQHLDGLDAPAATVIAEHRTGAATLYHRLYLPPDAASPAPLVVIPYPGLVWVDQAPPPDLAELDMGTNAQLLVARGYAVLQPSLQAPNAGPDMLDKIASDIANAIDAAARTGHIDKRRVAVLGHSYGGYAALAMATRGDVVRSVIAASAPINLAGAYGFIDPRAKEQVDGISTTIAFGWFEGGQGRLGLPPWLAPQLYVDASPFFRAGRFNVPVMLIHGEFDYLPIGGAEQMFMALYRQNKDAELVRYAAEGHSIRSPANVRDLWRRTFAWLDRMTSTSQPTPSQ